MHAELEKILRDEVLKGIPGGWEKLVKTRRELAAASPNKLICTDLELLTFLTTHDISNIRSENYADIRVLLVNLPQQDENLKDIFLNKFHQIVRTSKDSAKRVGAYLIAYRLNDKETHDAFPDYITLENELFCLANQIEDINSFIFLAYMHDSGIGTERDPIKSIENYYKAANKGSARAQYNLGLRYDLCASVPKDTALALSFFRKAAEQDYSLAEYELGKCFLEGKGVAVDQNEAAKWFQKAANQGRVQAYFELGKLYESGEGLPKDEKQAMECYRKAGEQEHVEAQLRLGQYHMSKKNFEEAAKWRSKTALMEKYDRQSIIDIANLANYAIPLAEYTLGACFFKGIGVRKNTREAIRWFRKSALHGYITAQYVLGAIYFGGQFEAPNKPEAIQWWVKAAEQGDSQAQVELGKLFELGNGLAQNDKRAAAWYQKAADQGHTEAQFRLGKFFQLGRGGLFKDENRAALYFRKAADQGHTYAQISLYCWLKAKNNHEEAAAYFSEIMKQEQDANVSETLRYALHGIDINKISITIMTPDGSETQREGIDAGRWLSVAAFFGNNKSRDMINQLQIMQAHKMQASPPSLGV